MGGSEQVLTDAAALDARTQATVTYQIARALQSTIGSLLDPAYTLVGVVRLCMYTEFRSPWMLRKLCSFCLEEKGTKFLTALLGIEVRTAAATALAILRCHAPPVGSYRKLR
jgi:hypothetical protein